MSNTPKADILLLDSHNLKTLVVGDISTYPQGFIVNNPTLEVTVPGFPRINITLTPRNITVLNSNDLNLTQVDSMGELVSLPDGIWEFKYSFSPANLYYVKKRFLRTENLQATFFNAFLKTDLSGCDEELREKDKKALDEIWYLIQGAIASANNCNEARAMEIYRLASKKLYNFLNCKN